MSSKLYFLFIGSLFLIHSACVNEHPENTSSFDDDHLVGRWEIIEAYRNGRKTETLTDTFYEFDQRGNMKTNLTPTASVEQFSYQFDGVEIKQEGGDETVFKVENLNDTSLTITMVIQKFPFRLVLAKAANDDDSEASQQGILQ